MDQNNIRLALIAAAFIIIGFGVWKYRQPNFGGGDKAPDLQITLTDGQTASLSQLRGKYVLLQFWGSWCGPCRQENPYLVQLYKQFHAKGFEIFSVGIEHNENRWRNAIEQDQMSWPYHTMESAEFTGSLAKQFNIKSIPTTFLLNPEGIIMGVNLTPDYLNKMLSEKL
jgi:thiol-disulfide isomerase/thioredoxin